MHIKSIYINGFLSFNNFNFTFKKENNVIVGTNGTGKTNYKCSVDIRLWLFRLYGKWNISDKEKEVKIEIEFEEENKVLFNKLFIIYLIQTFINFMPYPILNLENIIDYIKELNMFTLPIFIKCYYKNEKFMRKIYFALCENCDNKNLSDLKNHSEPCKIYKICKYIDNIDNYSSNMFNPSKQLFDEFIVKMKALNIFKVDNIENYSENDRFEALKKYFTIYLYG